MQPKCSGIFRFPALERKCIIGFEDNGAEKIQTNSNTSTLYNNMCIVLRRFPVESDIIKIIPCKTCISKKHQITKE